MSERKTIRIFISSPSDVRPERLIAERVVKRLDREFAYHFHVEAILWEREPLVATHHFQDFENIPPPSKADISVVILWSRLGVPLPADKFSGAISGKIPVTGTEWEFEDALRGYRESGKPDLLLYQKTAPVTASLDDDDALELQRQQKRLVEAFLATWFRSASGTEFTAASHNFAEASEFEERIETHLRALLRKRLDAAEQNVLAPGIRWHHGSPFRGLESFDPEHAPIFFGRTRARNELRELLVRQIAKDCAFMLVMGASGSGKSSLVKAGLLPDLMLPGMVGNVALCRYAIVKPSDGEGNPMAGLADGILGESALPELYSLRYTPERLTELLQRSPEQVAFAVEQGLSQAARKAELTELAAARLVLIVDQLEEIFTRDEVALSGQSAFVSAIRALAHSGFVWVIATMRSDFFDRLDSLPELARLSDGEARYLLSPPDANEIGQMIRQPAYEAGLRFAFDSVRGVSLDEELRATASRDPGSLPLLEFTLEQLWQRRTEKGVIGFDAYTDLGGLEGAIGRRAEEELGLLHPEVQGALPSVLQALVKISGRSGAVAARTAPLSRFAPGSERRALVDAFLAPSARLLVADGDGDEIRIRVAHEALLTHWERARRLIEDARADLVIIDRFEESASAWAESDDVHKPSLLLTPGLPLRQGLDALSRRRENLSPTLIRYIEASDQAHRRRVHQRRVVYFSLGTAAAALASVAYVMAADLKVSVPFAGTIRNTLDSAGIFLSRGVLPTPVLHGHAQNAVDALIENVQAQEKLGRLRRENGKPDVWAISQFASALLSAQNSPPASVKWAQVLLLDAMRHGETFEEMNAPGGWVASLRINDADISHAGSLFWTISAIARVLRHPEASFPASDREFLMGKLDFAFRSAEALQGPEKGAWRFFMSQANQTEYSPYAGALALTALLDLQEAGIGWQGNKDLLKEEIDSTIAWLLAKHKADKRHSGWVASDRVMSEVPDPGLSFQIYSLFLRAHQLSIRSMSPEMMSYVKEALLSISNTEFGDGHSANIFLYDITMNGKHLSASYPIRFVWIGWGIETAVRWLNSAEKGNAEAHERIAIRRVLDHLAADLQAEFIDRAKGKEWPWYSSELLFGLMTLTQKLHLGK